MRHLQGEAWLNSRQKRGTDLLIAGSLLPFAGPIIGLAALAVREIDQTDPLFKQIRIGRQGRRFAMYKLRTMPGISEDTPSRGINDERRSQLGIALSKHRLDELPQLWNVFKGDMSLVNNRPLVEGEHQLFQDVLDKATYCEVERAQQLGRPGCFHLFGLENQIRSFDSVEDKVKAHAEARIRYAEAASPAFDWSIVVGYARLQLDMLLTPNPEAA